MLTVFTTVITGAFLDGVNPLKHPGGLLRGIPFSASLLFILGTHEMGHYFASRRHGTPSSLPFFIPGPPIPPMIGTFGAVIESKSRINTRNALVDIGAAGPLAGFIAAVIITAWGLRLSHVGPKPSGEALNLGAPLIFELLSYLILGKIPGGSELFLHPVGFAGWTGLYITFINLMPIGQSDGGHVCYATLGRIHRAVSMAAASLLVLFGIFIWPGWLVWGVLTAAFAGISHPPVVDAHTPLSVRREAMSVLALAIFVLTFTPTPFYIG
ncbi:MAG: site-2 protease family protein [Deltaproteobacteria bacterium]|nr:site-2 protease family protein [Deltaproteobacteria bacterium]